MCTWPFMVSVYIAHALAQFAAPHAEFQSNGAAYMPAVWGCADGARQRGAPRGLARVRRPHVGLCNAQSSVLAPLPLCHQARWPEDGRSRNRHSRPVAIDDRRIVGGRSRGVRGDFYLTEAPPEHIADVPVALVRSRAAWKFAWPPPGRPWPFGTPMCVVYPAECSGATCPSRRLGRCDPSWAARLRSRSPLLRFPPTGACGVACARQAHALRAGSG